MSIFDLANFTISVENFDMTEGDDQEEDCASDDEDNRVEDEDGYSSDEVDSDIESSGNNIIQGNDVKRKQQKSLLSTIKLSPHRQ